MESVHDSWVNVSTCYQLSFTSTEGTKFRLWDTILFVMMNRNDENTNHPLALLRTDCNRNVRLEDLMTFQPTVEM